jgi:hypothetical protein
VFMWRMDLRALDALADAGGASVEPFAQALERERGGEEKSREFWTEMQDYFYFAQLKSQGEDTMRPRHIGPTVPLSQVSIYNNKTVFTFLILFFSLVLVL